MSSEGKTSNHCHFVTNSVMDNDFKVFLNIATDCLRNGMQRQTIVCFVTVHFEVLIRDLLAEDHTVSAV